MGRLLLVSAFHFVVERLFSTENVWTRIVGSDDLPVLVFGSYGENALSHVPTSSPVNEHVVDWDIAHVLRDYHIEVRASICQLLHDICGLCHFTNVAVSENAKEVVRLALQNLNAVEEHDPVVAAGPAVLECVHVD